MDNAASSTSLEQREPPLHGCCAGRTFTPVRSRHRRSAASSHNKQRMNASELPVHYHDVVGVAVIIGDEGYEPQEVFRYPFFNEGACVHMSLVLRTISNTLPERFLKLDCSAAKTATAPKLAALEPCCCELSENAVVYNLISAPSSSWESQQSSYYHWSQGVWYLVQAKVS